jgi:hypothetical protein
MFGGDSLRGKRLELRPLRGLSTVLVLGVAACSSSPPTWHQDIAPLLADHCMGCHRPGGIAPFSLTDYDSVRGKSHIMVAQIELGAMPPFSARTDDSCAPRFDWTGDPRLSDSEKAMLEQWMFEGYLLGDPAPPPPIAYADLARVSTTLAPEQGFTASGERDQFICYVLDVGNPELEWLSGLQIRPEQQTIVHHALIYAMAPDDAAPIVAEHGLGRPFDCSANGLPGEFQIHAWFPGNQPLQLATGMAMPLLPDSKIAIQIHYHPHGGIAGLDRTSIDLQFSPSPPEQLYFTASLGNETGAPSLLPGPGDTKENVPEFVIPMNSPDHTEHMRFLVSRFDHPEVRIVSVVPHMHFIGTGLALRLERAKARGRDPKTECLSNTGWNFDWQRTYAYDASFDRLPSISGGDTLDLQCTWNNTFDNPFVQRLLRDSNVGLPFDVRLGETTTNEMCLAILGLAHPAPRDLSEHGVAEFLGRATRSRQREPSQAPPPR